MKLLETDSIWVSCNRNLREKVKNLENLVHGASVIVSEELEDFIWANGFRETWNNSWDVFYFIVEDMKSI